MQEFAATEISENLYIFLPLVCFLSSCCGRVSCEKDAPPFLLRCAQVPPDSSLSCKVFFLPSYLPPFGGLVISCQSSLFFVCNAAD